MSDLVDYSKAFARYLIERNLVHLIVHVTNHCNFRCKHCFVDFTPKRDLKLDHYQRVGRDVGKLFWLDIGGGEPFLRKDLADIVAAFQSNVVQIPSNGSLPDQMEEQSRRMLESGREVVISLSLDGLQESHDRIRGQEGSWNQVWSTFERLRKIDGLFVKVLTVLQDGNADEIIPLMEEVQRRQPDHHSVILVRGETLDDTVHLPPMAELRRLGKEIFRLQEGYDYARSGMVAHILRNFHRYLWKISLRTLEEERQVIPCLAGKAHMVMMGDGSVSSCEMLEPVGDTKTQSWSEITSSQAFRDQVADIEAGKCHCTHNCAMFDSIFFRPTSYPRLLYQNPNADR